MRELHKKMRSEAHRWIDFFSCTVLPECARPEASSPSPGNWELGTGQPNVSRYIAALERPLEEKTRFTFLSRLSRCGIALYAGPSKFSGDRGQPIRGSIEDP